MRNPFARSPRVALALVAGACVLAALMVYVSPEAVPPARVTEVTETDFGLGQENERATASVDPERAALPGCALRFSLTPESKAVSAGDMVTYAALAQNVGSEVCRNVAFSIYYGEGEQFVSASPRATASDYYWSLGAIAPQKSVRVTIRTKAVGEAGRIESEACASGDNAGGDICPASVVFITGDASRASLSAHLVPAGKEFGTWIWESPASMSSRYAEAALDAADEAGMNAVYVTIDDYLAIAGMPEGAEKSAREKSYQQRLAAFIQLANARGIAVDAEGGARDWAKSPNRWKGYALIDFVKRYNAAYPRERLRGFQYDVEPYLLPEYESSKAQVLEDFLAFIDASASRLAGAADFSVVIPHFYDSAQAWTPKVSYGGITAHAYTHLLTILEREPGSTILIMAYRNFFDGDDGTEALVTPELEEAERQNRATRVIVAQETGNVDPPYVTFYGFSKRDLLTSLNVIMDSFSAKESFGGVAVHYLDTFLVLE